MSALYFNFKIAKSKTRVSFRQNARASAHWSFDYFETIVFICGTIIGVPKKCQPCIMILRLQNQKRAFFQTKQTRERALKL